MLFNVLMITLTELSKIMETTVELSEFITKTLIDITTGVRAANKELKEKIGSDNDYFTLEGTRGDKSKTSGIGFDIAVSATKDQKDKANFLISLANIGGGASTEKGNKSEFSHRIKFDVAIHYDFH